MNLLQKTANACYLDSRVLVFAVFAAIAAVYLWGELASPFTYSDPRFVIDYFGTELLVACGAILASWKLFPAAELGLRPPIKRNMWQIAPLLMLMLVATGAWLSTRISLPATAAPDNGVSWLVLRTTLLVGFNEEWIFRGLLLAAFSRWWGLQRGALVSVVMFGAFHLMNMAVGVAPAASLVQMLNTILLGSVFLIAALGFKSILPPMLAHAVYDFLVFDCNRLATPGAHNIPPILAVVVAGGCLGIWCFFSVLRLKPGEPFALN